LLRYTDVGSIVPNPGHPARRVHALAAPALAIVIGRRS
jgi:hypothetical protein